MTKIGRFAKQCGVYGANIEKIEGRPNTQAVKGKCENWNLPGKQCGRLRAKCENWNLPGNKWALRANGNRIACKKMGGYG